MSARQYVREKYGREKSPKVFVIETTSDGSEVTGYKNIADAITMPNSVRLVGVDGDMMKPDGELFGAWGEWKSWVEVSNDTVNPVLFNPMRKPNDVIQGYHQSGEKYGSGGTIRRLKQQRFCEE